MNTPTVAIFGPTVPEFGFGPLARRSRGRRRHGRSPAGRATATARSAARSDIGAACASLPAGDVAARDAATFCRILTSIPDHAREKATAVHHRRRPRRNEHRRRARCPRTARSTTPMRSDPDAAPSSGAEGVVDRIVGMIEGVILDTIARDRGAPQATSSASASARPAARPREGHRRRRAESRLARLSAARPHRRRGSTCPPRSTTTRTARRSASGGRARRAAARNVIGMTIGTGIGGGLIIDGAAVSRRVRRRRRDRPHDHRPRTAATASAATTAVSRRTRRGRRSRRARARCSCARRRRRCCRRWWTASSTRSRRRPCTTPRKQGDARRQRDRARHGALSRRGHRQFAQHLQPDVVVVAGGVTQRRRCALRSAPRRGAPARVPPAVDATRIVPGELPGTAGVVGAVATFKMQHWARSSSDAMRRRRLGVIGSFVWDMIYGREPRDSAPVEEWGGITLRAQRARRRAARRLGDRPAHQGRRRPRRSRARQFLGTPATASRPTPRSSRCRTPTIASSCATTPTSDAARCMTGGVPGWNWLGLKPVLDAARLDALYINFLSGWELDLETAQLHPPALSRPDLLRPAHAR